MFYYKPERPRPAGGAGIADGAVERKGNHWGQGIRNWRRRTICEHLMRGCDLLTIYVRYDELTFHALVLMRRYDFLTFYASVRFVNISCVGTIC